MKLWSVTKIDKRNKTASKKIDDGFDSKNCDAIAIFPIYNQFWAIQKPDSQRIVCKIYNFINSNLLSYKSENKTKKSLIQFSHYCFE